MTLYCRTVATPDGPFTIIADADAVLASGWTGDPDFLAARLGRDHWGRFLVVPTGGNRWGTDPAHDLSHCTDSGPNHDCPAVLDQALTAVAAYYRGDGTPAQQVPTHQPAAAFHARARRALRGIPYAHRITYAELAAAAGNPRAARAAATACSHNNTALFIPCHRVVRRDGAPGGFLYGPALKQSLLTREAESQIRFSVVFRK